MADLLVLGAGLIGASVGLAMVGSMDVVLSDRNPRALADAVDRGAGRPWDGQEPAELVVSAVPPSGVADSLAQVSRLGIGSVFTHVCSVQSQVQLDIELWHPHPASVCGGHPIAGSEASGPSAARSDLFSGRPWVVCAGPATTNEAIAAVTGLARACGAEPLRLTAAEHDATLALVSHLPQALSSALAAQLLGAEHAAALAGGGLRDTTRVAASDPGLWREILTLNATPLAPLLRAVSGELTRLADALAPDPLTPLAPLDATAAAEPAARDGAGRPRREVDPEAVEDLLRRGRAGRALLPVKREELGAAFTWVAVSVPDQPGQLVAVLTAAAQAEVNVEDVRLEHLPGRPRGLVQLAVRTQSRADAVRALRAAGHEVLSAD